MAGRGLVIAGGVVAIVRGVLQAISAIPVLGEQGLDAIVPGLTGLIWFEAIMAVLLIVIGALALVRSSSPRSGGEVRNLGIVAGLLGIANAAWAWAVFGAAGLSAAITPALGTLAVCLLVAGLLIAGGLSLRASYEGESDRATPRPRKNRRYRDTAVALPMLAPAVVLLSIFVIWPTIYAVYLSFQNWGFYLEPEFVGFRNFEYVLTDPQFWASIGRGFMFVLMTVPVMLVLAYLFASLVVAVSRRAASVLKVSIYIPTIISGVIASIIFVLIYAYPGGLLNAVLQMFGVDPIAFLREGEWPLVSIAIPAIWLGMGLTSLIMVAAMVDIPTEFYEAASMEGAGWWQKTAYITIPQMKNVFLFLLVTGFVAAIQQFELPLVMTGGGPRRTTELPNLFIFNHFRYDQTIGFSIAAALMLFVVLGTCSALIFKFVNSERLVD